MQTSLLPRFGISRLAIASIVGVAALALVACQDPENGADETEVSTATGMTQPDTERSTATPSTAPPTERPTVVPTAPTARATAAARPTATRQPQRSNEGNATDDFGRFDQAVLAGVDDLGIGVLLPANQAFDSVCDNVADGGTAFGASSIFNDQSPYGGPFGVNSPFNPDSKAPPRIVQNGQPVGYLTVSPVFEDSIDPHGLLAHLGCPVQPN